MDLLGTDLRDRLPDTLLFGVPTRSLRLEPRFMTVAARAGLVANGQRTDQWADFCDAGAVPYDCRKEAQIAMSADPRPLAAPGR